MTYLRIYVIITLSCRGCRCRRERTVVMAASKTKGNDLAQNRKAPKHEAYADELCGMLQEYARELKESLAAEVSVMKANLLYEYGRLRSQPHK